MNICEISLQNVGIVGKFESNGLSLGFIHTLSQDSI